MTLDDLFGAPDAEPAPERRGRMAAQTFGLAVVAAGLCVVLLGLVLYALGVGAAAVWDEWWDGFA